MNSEEIDTTNPSSRMDCNLERGREWRGKVQQLHISFCDNRVIVDSVSHTKVYHTMDQCLTNLPMNNTLRKRMPVLLFRIIIRERHMVIQVGAKSYAI